MKGIIGLFALMLAGSLHAAESFLTEAEIASLTPHPAVEGVSRYLTPGVDPGAYSKIIVGSMTFYFAEKSKSKDVDADEMVQISDALKAAVVTAAADSAEVVLEPGPGALLLNISITDVNMQNKKRGLLGFTPIGFVVTSAGNLSGSRIQLRDANIEGEAVDSVTGKVVSIFRIDEISNLDEKKGMSWEDLRLTLHDYVSKALAAVNQ